eukprot:Clim_evm2s231 gene=Clim_evmTU2s231
MASDFQDLDDAVRACMDPLCNPERKARATAICSELKSSADGWRIAAEKYAQFHGAGPPSADSQILWFFYLQVVEDMLRGREHSCSYESLSQQDWVYLRNTILQVFQGSRQTPPFIANKFAQIVALLIRRTYVQGLWASAFSDLTSVGSERLTGTQETDNTVYILDTLIGILQSVDEEVVSRELNRSDEENKLNTKIKDTMRLKDVALIVGFLENCTRWAAGCAPGTFSYSLGNRCLGVLSTYVIWIDINFVVNQQFLSFLYDCSTLKGIRIGASQVMMEIGRKGMPDESKVQLLEMCNHVQYITEQIRGFQNLNLNPSAGRTPETDEERELFSFMYAIARLVDAIGEVLIAICLHIRSDKYGPSTPAPTPNSTPRGTASSIGSEGRDGSPNGIKLNGGLALNYDSDLQPISKSPELVLSCTSMLDNLFAALLWYLQYGDEDMVEIVHEYGRSYIGLQKQLKGSKTGGWGPRESERLYQILSVIADRMKMPQDLDPDNDDMERFEDFRLELKTLFDNVAHTDSRMTMEFVKDTLTRVLQGLPNGASSEQTAKEVERSLKMFHYLLEALPGNPFADPEISNEVFSMMEHILTSKVTEVNSKMVMIEYFENAVRYAPFFKTKREYLPIILRMFCSNAALGSQNAAMRSRIAYLLMRFVRQMRVELNTYADDLLGQFQPYMSIVPQAGLPFHGLDISDQLYLYEAAGLMVTADGVPNSQRRAHMESIVGLVINDFREVVNRQLWQNPDANTATMYGTYLANVIQAVTASSKGFTTAAGVKTSDCQSLFKNCLELFLEVSHVPASRDRIRNALRQYLHRMIACLGEDLLPYLSVAIHKLLDDSNYRDVRDLLPFINNVMVKFKGKMEAILNAELIVIVRSIFNSSESLSHELNDTVTPQEILELKKSYFSFLYALSNNGLLNVFRSDANRVHFQEILGTVLQGSEEEDPTIQKSSFAFLRKLVELWGTEKNDDLSGFDDFILTQVFTKSFMTPMRPSFDLDDAQTVLALNEISELHIAINKAYGKTFVDYISLQYLPSIQMPQDQIQKYVQTLAQNNAKKLRKFLTGLIKLARGQ